MASEKQRDHFSLRLQHPSQAADKHSQGELGEQVSPHSMNADIDRAHVELIQQVQHEIRTPVHGLLGTLEDLRHDLRNLDLDRATLNAIMVKMDSLDGLAERLQNVLDDFRDYTTQATETIIAREAEEKHEVVPQEPVDLGQLLDDVAAAVWKAQVRQIRAEGGADARLPPPPELILQIETSLRGWKTIVDTSILRKLVHKLVSNALRFTKEGFVEISLAPAVRTPPPSADHGLDSEDEPQASERFVELVVEDTGEGMTEDFLSHQLFEPFVKADKFKTGAGLSMTLCSSLVRQMGGSMHVSSDKGRGTIVNVHIPVQSLPDLIIEPAPPSQSDQLIYLYGFEGWGLQRLAQVISAQLATFGNLYCTSHIEDADYLLLPEEVCFEVDGGAAAILECTKPGVKVGVLQAHEDAGIEYAAFRNGSRRPTFVTRKPFGPRCFAKLLQLAEQSGSHETRDRRDYTRDEDGHLGYCTSSSSEASTPSQPCSPMSPSTMIGRSSDISTGPLTCSDRARMPQKAAPDSDAAKDGSSATATMSKGTDTAPRRERPLLAKLKGGPKLADLVVTPDAMDRLLRAPNPAPKILPPPPMRLSSTSSSSAAMSRDPGSGSSVPERGGADAADSAPRFTVLCCEDNPLNMRILTTMLRQSKIEFYEAVDGVEAVEQFRRHLPTVTLLDINMPRMTGFEACKLMREFVEKRKHEPEIKRRTFRIVAVTALSDDFHRQKGLECGMDEWFSKPLKMNQLKSSLSGWKKELEAQSCTATANAVAGPVVDSPP
ncbi:hypothetical protein ACQY0O_008216 [Thecaphora frezii]